MAETENQNSKNSTKNVNFSKTFYPKSKPDPSRHAPDSARQNCSPLRKRSEPPIKSYEPENFKNWQRHHFGTKNRQFGQQKVIQPKNVSTDFFLYHHLVAACKI